MISKHTLYKTWKNMLDRCNKENHPRYASYGGRGITVCAGLSAHPAAIEQAIGPRPGKLQLDRPANDAGYTCGECEECRVNGWKLNIRWATCRQNQNNRRNNILVEFGGETKTVSQWSRATKIPKHVIIFRLNNGWLAEDALTTPVNTNHSIGRLLEYNGETRSIAEWSRVTGILSSTLHSRLEQGWPVEIALTTPVGHPRRSPAQPKLPGLE